MAASIFRMRNANLDIAVQPIQKPKQSLYTKTAKITVLCSPTCTCNQDLSSTQSRPDKPSGCLADGVKIGVLFFLLQVAR